MSRCVSPTAARGRPSPRIPPAPPFLFLPLFFSFLLPFLFFLFSFSPSFSFLPSFPCFLLHVHARPYSLSPHTRPARRPARAPVPTRSACPGCSPRRLLLPDQSSRTVPASMRAHEHKQQQSCTARRRAVPPGCSPLPTCAAHHRPPLCALSPHRPPPRHDTALQDTDKWPELPHRH